MYLVNSVTYPKAGPKMDRAECTHCEDGLQKGCQANIAANIKSIILYLFLVGVGTIIFYFACAYPCLID